MKNKNLGYIIYIGYNLILFVLILWLLLFAMMYLNGAIIPTGLKWQSDGTLRKNLLEFNLVHLLVVFIEGLLLLFFTFLLNNLFLKNVINKANHKRVAMITLAMSSLILLILAYFEIYL